MWDLSRITAARAQYRRHFEAVGYPIDIEARISGVYQVQFSQVLAWENNLKETAIAQNYSMEAVSFLLLAEDMSPNATAGHDPVDLQESTIIINNSRWNIVEVDWLSRREAGVTLAYHVICEGQGG